MRKIWFAVLAIAAICACVNKPKPIPQPVVFTDSTSISVSPLTITGKGPLVVSDRSGAICELPADADESKLVLEHGRNWEQCAKMLMWVQLQEMEQRKSKP